MEKRQSIKLPEKDWVALSDIAKHNDATYRGNASWRTLVRRIAEGKIKTVRGDASFGK